MPVRKTVFHERKGEPSQTFKKIKIAKTTKMTIANFTDAC